MERRHDLRFDARFSVKTLFFWMEEKFLHGTVKQVCGKDYVLGWARDLVNPAKLFELFAGFAEDAQYLSFEAQLVHPPRKRVGGVEHLIGSRGDAHGPWGTGCLRAGGVGAGFLADGRDCARIIKRHIDRDLTEEFAVAVEHLDASVATVGDVDISLRVGRDVGLRL